jgi:hypothetical protein
MNLIWVKLPATKEWGAMLGKIFIGGISTHQTGIANMSRIYLVNCFLPSVNMHIREFATLKETKEDFTKAVEDWITRAGL